MNKLLTLTFTALFAVNVWAGESIDKFLDVKADGQVSINIARGEIVIKGWEKNQVRVNGKIDDDATGYTFETSGGRTVFKIEMPRNIFGDRYKGSGSELEIMLPAGNSVQFDGVNANVTAGGISGGTKIHVVNGSVDASELSSTVIIETVNGHIIGKNLGGDIKLKTVNGNIADTGSKGKLEINTVNGSVDSKTEASKLNISNVNSRMDLNSGKVKDLIASTVNGSIAVTSAELDGNANIRMSSVSGGLQLRLTKSVSAAFDIKTNAGGAIINKLSSHPVITAKHGPSKSLQFSLHGGSSEVALSTVSGRIELTPN